MMRIRSFLVATALSGAISLVPVLASQAGAATAPATVTPDWVTQPGAQWRATALTGLDVYDRQGETLGTITDLLVDPQGRITTAVLSVGGFLGIGDRLVGVPFRRLQFAFRTPDGSDVTADGQKVAIGGDGNTAPPRPASGTPSGRTDTVGSAVGNAGRAVGHAAVVMGSAAAQDFGNAIDRMRQTGASPDAALLDASKDQLMQAPPFHYVPAN